MAKLSANYEVLYIIDPTLGEEETAALVARFKELAEGHGTVTEMSGASASWPTSSTTRTRATMCS